MKKFLKATFMVSFAVVCLALLAGLTSAGPIEMPLHIAKVVACVIGGSIAGMFVSLIGLQVQKN